MAEKKLKHEAEEFTGKSKRIVAKLKTGGGFDYETIEDTRKLFDVYLPRGHSVRVSEKELRRMNLDKAPRLVDMESGDESALPSPESFSPKDAVRQATKAPRRAGFVAA